MSQFFDLIWVGKSRSTRMAICVLICFGLLGFTILYPEWATSRAVFLYIFAIPFLFILILCIIMPADTQSAKEINDNTTPPGDSL